MFLLKTQSTILLLGGSHLEFSYFLALTGNSICSTQIKSKSILPDSKKLKYIVTVPIWDVRILSLI
jgi:hypothetical protein